MSSDAFLTNTPKRFDTNWIMDIRLYCSLLSHKFIVLLNHYAFVYIKVSLEEKEVNETFLEESFVHVPELTIKCIV